MDVSRHVSSGTRGYVTSHISADAVVLPARGIPSYTFVMSDVTHSCGDTTNLDGTSLSVFVMRDGTHSCGTPQILMGQVSLRV